MHNRNVHVVAYGDRVTEPNAASVVAKRVRPRVRRRFIGENRKRKRRFLTATHHGFVARGGGGGVGGGGGGGGGDGCG